MIDLCFRMWSVTSCKKKVACPEKWKVTPPHTHPPMSDRHCLAPLVCSSIVYPYSNTGMFHRWRGYCRWVIWQVLNVIPRRKMTEGAMPRSCHGSRPPTGWGVERSLVRVTRGVEIRHWWNFSRFLSQSNWSSDSASRRYLPLNPFNGVPRGF